MPDPSATDRDAPASPADTPPTVMTVVSVTAQGTMISTYGGPLVIRAVEVTAKDSSGKTLEWETSVEEAPRVGDSVTVAMALG